jgi:hypothetical protein
MGFGTAVEPSTRADGVRCARRPRAVRPRLARRLQSWRMVRGRARTVLHAALLCAAVLPSSPGWTAGMPRTRRTVCTISFNGSEEVEVFRAFLPPEEFDFVDLAPGPAPAERPGPGAGPGSSGDSGRTWILDACRPDVRCDVVIYAGEFAGQFFGSRPYSLGLQAMEEASCHARCDGLFHDAQEVFLLACNTLATKDEDRRTPAEYLQVLLDHGFDRASAENVVEMRYGPLGPSFRGDARELPARHGGLRATSRPGRGAPRCQRRAAARVPRHGADPGRGAPPVRAVDWRPGRDLRPLR